MKGPRSSRPRPTVDPVTGTQHESIRRRVFRYTRAFAREVMGYRVAEAEDCAGCALLIGLPPQAGKRDEQLHFESHMQRAQHPVSMAVRAFKHSPVLIPEYLWHALACRGMDEATWRWRGWCVDPKLHPSPEIREVGLSTVDLSVRRLIYTAYGLKRPYWPVERINPNERASKRKGGKRG